MDRETIAISPKALDRVAVIRKVLDGELKQGDAAQQLRLSVRAITGLPRRSGPSS